MSDEQDTKQPVQPGDDKTSEADDYRFVATIAIAKSIMALNLTDQMFELMFKAAMQARFGPMNWS